MREVKIDNPTLPQLNAACRPDADPVSDTMIPPPAGCTIQGEDQSPIHYRENTDLPHLVTRNAATLTTRPLRWLWHRRLPLGKLAILAGDPGLGKSLITCAMAAAITTAGPWPDGAPAELGRVVMVSGEDDPDDTTVPRLNSAGADLARIEFVDGLSWGGQYRDTRKRQFTLADVDHLRDVARRVADLKLITIDPISAFMPAHTDGHNNAEVRRMLAPLAALAREVGACVLMVTHLNKSNGRALHRAMGSLAFVAAARSAWGVAADPTDPDRRLLLPVKNNLGNDAEGFAFRLAADPLNPDAPCRLEWEPHPITDRIDHVLSETSEKSRPTPAQRTAAAAWLQAALAPGPCRVSELRQQAQQAGLAWRTVHRAADDLGVHITKSGFPPTGHWRLPVTPPWAPTTPYPHQHGTNGYFGTNEEFGPEPCLPPACG